MTTAWFGGVRRWTLLEIEADVATARADFRMRRLGEPLARYLAAFDATHPRLRQLVGEIDRVLAALIASQRVQTLRRGAFKRSLSFMSTPGTVHLPSNRRASNDCMSRRPSATR